MKRPCLAAFAACALIAFAAQAQDPKKSEAAPAKPAAQDPVDPIQPKPGDTPDPRIVEGIINCLAPGLTPDWKKAWIVIKEIDRDESKSVRQFEGNFFYATKESDTKGKQLQTCGGDRIVAYVGLLNGYLKEDQQGWTSMSMTFMRDGRYDAKYDYTPVESKPKPPAKPAAKAAAKKQEPAKQQ